MARKARAWFSVHSWLGVTFGLLLFLICWSGTFATISKELDWLAIPQNRTTESNAREDLINAYLTVQNEKPDAEIIAVERPDIKAYADRVLVYASNKQYRYVYFDPFQGEIIGSSSRLTVQGFFRALHMNLFDLEGLGFYVVGAFGLILVISLSTSLVFYKRWWTRFFELRINRGAKVLWSGLHKLAGLWSIWFVLVMSITGTWYLFEHSRYELGDGIISFSSVGTSAAQPLAAAAVEDIDTDARELFAAAQAARSDMDIRTIVPNDGGYFYVDGQSEHLLVRNRANKLYLDKGNGRAVYDQNASDLPVYWRLADTADPLHFGNFGGLVSKFVWFAFGIFLSGLALSGAYLHAMRLQGNARSNGYRNATLAAIAVTVLVIAVSIKEGIAFLLKLGPEVDGIRQWPDAEPAVIIIIGAWVFVTLGILLVFCVALTRPHLKILFRDRELPLFRPAARWFSIFRQQ